MWILLALSSLAASFRLSMGLTLLAAALLTAGWQGVLHWPGAAGLALIGLLAVARRRYARRRATALLCEALLVLAAVGLLLHLLPGFTNPRIIEPQQTGPLSGPPFSFGFNLDKALIPFVLLACLPRLLRAQQTAPRPLWQWGLLVLAIPALLCLAVALGGLGFERHMPGWFWSFAFANLFFVSLAEEALFRGWLQQRLSQRIGHPLALVAASLIFGLAHLPGGLLLVAFASLAGLIYGLAWWWSGRLWVATGFHLALNLTHLLFFTYPMLHR